MSSTSIATTPLRTADRALTEADVPSLFGEPDARVHSSEGAALDISPTGLLIDGSFTPATDGRTLAVEDPATGHEIAEVADASPADCMAALEAAVAAQGAWAASAPRDRARVLRRAADALRDQSDEMAALLTAEMGKPLAESRAEVEFAADYLEWFAEEAVRISGRSCASPDGENTHLVVRTPVGPCLAPLPTTPTSCAPRSGRA